MEDRLVVRVAVSVETDVTLPVEEGEAEVERVWPKDLEGVELPEFVLELVIDREELPLPEELLETSGLVVGRVDPVELRVGLIVAVEPGETEADRVPTALLEELPVAVDDLEELVVLEVLTVAELLLD